MFFIGVILLLFSLHIVHVYALEIDQTTRCTRVIDGDSFNTSFGEIRLADINSPEFNQGGYAQAKNALSSLILNKQIYLDIDDVYRKDQYGRYVCVCYVKSSSSQYLNVNKYLVSNGFAVIQNYDNEFSPFSWSLYYPVGSNGGNGGLPSTGFDYNVLPIVIIGLIAIIGIISYFIIKYKS
jgi:LPXTG-motif cell wall-anchored protein